jgi:hypothetical protein
MAVPLRPVAAAKVLGVHPGTLANWRSLGVGPKFIRRGKRVWYTLRDLNRYARERQAWYG